MRTRSTSSTRSPPPPPPPPLRTWPRRRRRRSSQPGCPWRPGRRRSLRCHLLRCLRCRDGQIRLSRRRSHRSGSEEYECFQTTQAVERFLAASVLLHPLTSDIKLGRFASFPTFLQHLGVVSTGNWHPSLPSQAPYSPSFTKSPLYSSEKSRLFFFSLSRNAPLPIPLPYTLPFFRRTSSLLPGNEFKLRMRKGGGSPRRLHLPCGGGFGEQRLASRVYSA